jgi:hypothetical protein
MENELILRVEFRGKYRNVVVHHLKTENEKMHFKIFGSKREILIANNWERLRVEDDHRGLSWELSSCSTNIEEDRSATLLLSEIKKSLAAFLLDHFPPYQKFFLYFTFDKTLIGGYVVIKIQADKTIYETVFPEIRFQLWKDDAGNWQTLNTAIEPGLIIAVGTEIDIHRSNPLERTDPHNLRHYFSRQT